MCVTLLTPPANDNLHLDPSIIVSMSFPKLYRSVSLPALFFPPASGGHRAPHDTAPAFPPGMADDMGHNHRNHLDFMTSRFSSLADEEEDSTSFTDLESPASSMLEESLAWKEGSEPTQPHVPIVHTFWASTMIPSAMASGEELASDKSASLRRHRCGS